MCIRDRLTSTLGTSHKNNLGLRKLTCTDWLRLAANHAIVIVIIIRLKISLDPYFGVYFEVMLVQIIDAQIK